MIILIHLDIKQQEEGLGYFINFKQNDKFSYGAGFVYEKF